MALAAVCTKPFDFFLHFMISISQCNSIECSDHVSIGKTTFIGAQFCINVVCIFDIVVALRAVIVGNFWVTISITQYSLVCSALLRSICIICYAMVTCKIKLFQPSSTSDCNNFISARGNLPEIFSELFQKLITAHEYFPTCSVSLK